MVHSRNLLSERGVGGRGFRNQILRNTLLNCVSMACSGPQDSQGTFGGISTKRRGGLKVVASHTFFVLSSSFFIQATCYFPVLSGTVFQSGLDKPFKS